MSITTISTEYFQKSRIFLYPALGIKRGAAMRPIQTHVSWSGHYKPGDCKLICLYSLRNDPEFKYFEKNTLLKHSMFYDFKQVEDNKGVYVFDYTKLKDDWNYIINSRYSQVSDAHKKKIKDFIGAKDGTFKTVESYLHPEQYFDIYAKLLHVKVEDLKNVGELCSHIDFEQENLTIGIKDLHINHQIT